MKRHQARCYQIATIISYLFILLKLLSVVYDNVYHKKSYLFIKCQISQLSAHPRAASGADDTNDTMAIKIIIIKIINSGFYVLSSLNAIFPSRSSYRSATAAWLVHVTTCTAYCIARHVHRAVHRPPRSHARELCIKASENKRAPRGDF